jgi:hypothetical protein
MLAGAVSQRGRAVWKLAAAVSQLAGAVFELAGAVFELAGAVSQLAGAVSQLAAADFALLLHAASGHRGTIFNVAARSSVAPDGRRAARAQVTRTALLAYAKISSSSVFGPGPSPNEATSSSKYCF